jgi:hypothetical protein
VRWLGWWSGHSEADGVEEEAVWRVRADVSG